MPKKFIQKSGSPTVYYRQGDTLRPIASEADFTRLNAGNSDIAGNTDLVDAFGAQNNIGGILSADEIGNISSGAYVDPLSTEEKTSIMEGSKKKYDSTKQAYNDLITGRVSTNELEFDDTKTRLQREADDSIAGAAQDLSSRGFLRSGEQVDKTVRFKEDSARNIQKADIARQIAKANLLLEQAGFNADIEKQVMQDANTEMSNELGVRSQRAGVNQENVSYQRQQEQNKYLSEQLQKENDLKLRLAEMELQKARASGGSGQGSAVANAIKDMMAKLGIGQPAVTNTPAPQAAPSADEAKSAIKSQARAIFEKALAGGGIDTLGNRFTEREMIFPLQEQYKGILNPQEIEALIYETRKPYEHGKVLYGGTEAKISQY